MCQSSMMVQWQMEKPVVLMLVVLMLLLHSSFAGVLTVFPSASDHAWGVYPLAPAAFGPALAPAGNAGLLQAAEPLDGCHLLHSVLSNNTILIMQRSAPHATNACSFVDKVQNAANAGASAAIIFNYASDRLLIMSKEASDPVRVSTSSSILGPTD